MTEPCSHEGLYETHISMP